MELSAQDFKAGRWQSALHAVGNLPPPQGGDPPSSGAPEAARFIASFF